jgi:hypothetical protein
MVDVSQVDLGRGSRRHYLADWPKGGEIVESTLSGPTLRRGRRSRELRSYGLNDRVVWADSALTHPSVGVH